MIIDTAKYKSILCLNGDLPDASFFNVNLPIFAADGATNSLIEMGITPRVAIGDLDSITSENKTKVATHLHYDQNHCDFEKSLKYLHEHDLLPTVIVGINGGYLDHIINNINHFINTENLLYAPPIYGYVIRSQQKKSHQLPINTKLSLIGIPTANISTQGLKWNLAESQLSFPGSNSCFNRTNDENIQITVHDGDLLVLIYEDLAAQ